MVKQPIIPTTKPRPATLVWLHGLPTLRLNGQRGIVLKEATSAGCNLPSGWCAIKLLDAVSSLPISVKLLNLSLSPTCTSLLDCKLAVSPRNRSEGSDTKSPWGPPVGLIRISSSDVTASDPQDPRTPRLTPRSIPATSGDHQTNGDASPIYRIKKAPGQVGLGMFATRFIPAGETTSSGLPLCNQLELHVMGDHCAISVLMQPSSTDPQLLLIIFCFQPSPSNFKSKA